MGEFLMARHISSMLEGELGLYLEEHFKLSERNFTKIAQWTSLRKGSLYASVPFSELFGCRSAYHTLSQSLATTFNQDSYKTSEIVGKSVKNLEGEELGQIEEFVIGTTEEFGYTVLSFGGFLGVGEKLFAVPWNTSAHRPDGVHLTLDIQSQKLEKALGFNKNDRPDMKDEKWKLLIMVIKFYSTPKQIPHNPNAP